MTESIEPKTLGFETDFIFKDSDALLSIKNNERVNRALATQDHIGKTGYSAYARHVQYGTYQDKPACLLGVDFAFRFPSKANSRFTSAEIEVTFEKALNSKNPSLRSTDASLDPIVANFAPKEILGSVVQRENKKSFEIEVPIVFDVPFGSAGITTKWTRKTTFTEEGRSEVHGNLAQDDEHADGANSVTWDLTENPVSKDGILRSFRGVFLLFCVPGEALWMHVSVKPVVSFSLDPRRLYSKKLIRERDDPVLLDGTTTLGNSSCFEYEKFDADDFPWDPVLKLPGPLGGATA
jgi:hypothetical protein